MPRGRKKGHKGGHRHFTNEEELSAEAEKARKQKEWRTKMGIESEEDEEEDAGAAAGASKDEARAANRDLPPSSSEEETDSEDDSEQKAKGVQHLIEVENPNRAVKQTKKVTDIGDDASKAQLSRREREEIEKQRAKENYQRLHMEGKTEEARADMARLALIRKQRDDAARKREEERKAKEDAKTAAEKKLLERRSKAGK